jgi:hypothetical protein
LKLSGDVKFSGVLTSLVGGADGSVALQIVPDRKVTKPSSLAQDEELGERLWNLTEKILNEKVDSLAYRT